MSYKTETNPPYRVGRKQHRVILDADGLEVAHFMRGNENLAQEVCGYLNKRVFAEGSTFAYCQSEIEGGAKCTRQCDHCTLYYKPLEDERNSKNDRPTRG